MNYFFLSKTALFNGIQEDEIKHLISCLNGRTKTYTKGDVIASEDTEVMFLDLSKLLSTCQSCCSFHHRLIHNMLRISAQKSLNLSSRMMHTAPKGLRDRLLSYLSEQAIIHGSTHFTIPFDRQQLADYLGVDRSAMSNELSKMQKDGLISYKKNKFVLNEMN